MLNRVFLLPLLAHLAVGWWMIRYPVALPSEDALFFARGLTHFSVLEFSPHFPGYPGLMLLGRLVLLVIADPVRALWLVTVSTALLLPVAMAWAVARLGGRPLLAYALGLTLPLLSCLGLSLLSDGLGVFFLVLFIGLCARPSVRAWGWGGAVLGMALACRPSAGVFVVVALGLALWLAPQAGGVRWRPRVMILTGMMAVLLPLFGTVFLLEGWPYVAEGWRFLYGHLFLWGQTMVSETAVRPSWSQSLRSLPVGRLWAVVMLGVAAALAVSLGKVFCRRGRLIPAGWLILAGTWGAATAWTLAFQNPANPRHLAPVLVLLALMLASLPRRWARGMGWSVVALQASMAWFTLDVRHSPAERFPPAHTAVQVIDAFARPGQGETRPVTLFSNTALELFRHELPMVTVVDAYYRDDTESVMRTTSGCLLRISTQPWSGRFGDRLATFERTFAGRFWGEGALYLYGTRECVSR